MSDNDDDYMCEEEEDYGLVSFATFVPATTQEVSGLHCRKIFCLLLLKQVNASKHSLSYGLQ